MSNHKSDDIDELEILEKPVKKKQISLNSCFSCSSSSNKVKNNSKKQRKNPPLQHQD